MLEGLRRHSNSLFLIVLVASVATIFGVGWGPGQQGCSQGSLRVTYAAKVYGRTITEAEYAATLSTVSNLTRRSDDENPAVRGAVRQGALDGLIERELLAHEAERLGIRVTDDQVDDEFRQCHFYASVGAGAEAVLGMRSGRIEFPPTQCGGVGDAFDFSKFERLSRSAFRRTVADLRASTAREMLAQRMRDSVRSTVQISDEEMWRDYQRTHDQMAVRYLRFSLNFYRSLVRDDDDAQVEAWAGQHAEEIQRQWERRRESLRGLHREFRARHILVKYPEGATDAQKAEVRARAEAIRVQLAAGGDFVRLARLYSEDPGSWREGGLLPWTAAEGSNFDPAFVRAAVALQPRGISPVTESAHGCHVIQLLAFREGDVSEGDAKRDIARTLFRESHGPELARDAARAAQTAFGAAAGVDAAGAAAHAAALREFYRGEVPASVTLAGGVTLAPATRTDDDLGAPTLHDSEVFARNGFVVSDVEHGELLTSAAFELTQEHPLPAEPVQAGDDWFAMRFKDGSRTVATREEFARQRQELLASNSALAARQRDVLVQYLTRLRQEAEHEGQVHIGNSPRLRTPANGESEGD